MKVNIIKVVLIILLLGTFFMIFKFSNQTGEESGGISQKITEIITRNIDNIQNLEENQKEEKMKQIEHLIRKIAHFTIYTVVGILIMGVLTIYKVKKYNKMKVSLIIGVGYAILDEIHQAFIPERTARVTDVIIDACGVILGILFVFAIEKVIQKKKVT